MTKPIPTTYLQVAATKTGIIVLFWFVMVLALWAGGTAARAADAVVTFTNTPSAVSNTYDGVITLQIYGLTNGVTNVVVQKFLDVNTNGAIDGRDLLVQQFQLAVGQTTVFTNGSTAVTVTNFMPGDMTSTPGQITAPLNFQNGDFAQTIAGQYLYKISSPSGQFSAVTNLFTVTNGVFSSVITGAVENVDSGTNIPNALVLLCVAQDGTIDVQAGAVANDSGIYSLRAPPGSYFLAAAKSNFVMDVSGTGFALNAQSTNFDTIDLTPATTNINGRLVSAASGSGLSGVSGMVLSTNDYLSFYFTDTNGNFHAPVITNSWVAPVDSFAAAFQGYLTWQTYPFINVSNKVVNYTNSLPPETAIFYGTVSNNTAEPMPGVYLYASDNAGHQSYGITDQRGDYVVGILAGTNQWQLSILSTNNPGLTNTYVINPGIVQTNSISTNEAIQQNFVLAPANLTISGTVLDVYGNPIGGVEVYATATNYQAFSTLTTSSGTYSLNVSPGATWTVGLNASNLVSQGYDNIPPTQSVYILDADATVNFTILVCGEIEILTTNLPAAVVGTYYETNLQAMSCQNISNWSTAYGITLTSLYDQTNITYPAGTAIYSDSKMVGYLESYFIFGVEKVDGLGSPFFNNITGNAQVYDPSHEEFTDLSAPVNLSGPITNAAGLTVTINGQTWAAAPTTQSGPPYSTTLTLNEYIMYYNGNTVSYKATNGMLITSSGSPSNTVGFVAGAFHSIVPGDSANAGSTIAYKGTNDGVVWIQNGKNTGQYLISAYGTQSTNLPPGLTLYPDGTLAGTPASTMTNGMFNFTVQVEDTASNETVQPFSLFVYPATTIKGPTPSQSGSLESSNVFQMHVNGVLAGLNYTVLMSTNLLSTNWTSIFTTNTVTTNAFSVPDANATNSARFYRIQISQ